MKFQTYIDCVIRLAFLFSCPYTLFPRYTQLLKVYLYSLGIRGNTASKTQNADTKEKIWAFSRAGLSLGYLLPLVPVSPGCGRLRQLTPCPESGVPTTGCPWWPLRSWIAGGQGEGRRQEEEMQFVPHQVAAVTVCLSHCACQAALPPPCSLSPFLLLGGWGDMAPEGHQSGH